MCSHQLAIIQTYAVLHSTHISLVNIFKMIPKVVWLTLHTKCRCTGIKYQPSHFLLLHLTMITQNRTLLNLKPFALLTSITTYFQLFEYIEAIFKSFVSLRQSHPIDFICFQNSGNATKKCKKKISINHQMDCAQVSETLKFIKKLPTDDLTVKVYTHWHEWQSCYKRSLWVQTTNCLCTEITDEAFEKHCNQQPGEKQSWPTSLVG